jgi:hypothetical protein
VLQLAKIVSLHFMFSSILLFRQLLMLTCNPSRRNFLQVRAHVLVQAPDHMTIAYGVFMQLVIRPWRTAVSSLS